jgi:hypothetical protein
VNPVEATTGVTRRSEATARLANERRSILHPMTPQADLWSSQALADWTAALASYDAVIDRQGVQSLGDLDRWYRLELPGAIASRTPRHVTLDELVMLTQWKMSRGVWRARNLALVRSNAPARVVEVTTEAISHVPDPTRPIRMISELTGVGPATSSGVAAAAAPAEYPFLDDVVAAQIPHLPAVAFTVAFYAKYADAIRLRAAQLGGTWTPVMVEQALWAHAGGKAGTHKES